MIVNYFAPKNWLSNQKHIFISWGGGTGSILTLSLKCMQSIVTVELISSYKLVNTRKIMIVNQTQPVLLSQPHLKGTTLFVRK